MICCPLWIFAHLKITSSSNVVYFILTGVVLRDYKYMYVVLFRFKFKVGANLEEDIRRLRIVRDEIGYDIPMVGTIS